MTSDEFWTWFDDYCAAFPGVDTYIGKLPNEGKPTLKHWSNAMQDVRLSDACEVTVRIVRGDIPAVKQFEIGETPAIIRRHAKAIEHAGKVTEEREVEHRAARDRKLYEPSRLLAGMRALAKQLEEMQKSGATYAEQQAWLDQQFPTNPDDRRERFRCRLCRDSGFVDVAHPDLLDAIVQGRADEYRGRRTACCGCKCSAHKRHEKSKIATYSPLEHYRVERESDPGLVDAISAWLDERRMAKVGAGRNADFDRWNEQEGF